MVCGIPVHTHVSTCWPLGEKGEEEESRLNRADGSSAHSQGHARPHLHSAPYATHLPHPRPSPATDHRMLLLAKINSKEDIVP